MRKLSFSAFFFALLAGLVLTHTDILKELRPSSNPLWGGFASGQSYRYLVTIDSQSTFDVGRMLLPVEANKKSLLPPNQLRIRVRDANLDVSVIRKSEAGLELTLSMGKLSLDVESSLLNPSGIESLEKELKLPVSVALEPDGNVQAFYFSPSQSQLAQNLLRSMILHLLPRRSQGKIWEEGPQGESLVVYESNSSGQINKRFQDHKIKTSKVQPVIEGDFSYSFDAENGTLARIDGKRKIMAQQSGNFYFDDHFSLVATLLDNRPSKVSWLNTFSLRLIGQKAYSDAREQLEMLEYQLNVKVIEGQSFNDLEVELRNEASKLRAADQVYMYRKLKAHLALNPSLVSDFKQLIKEFGSSDPRFDMLVTLLATNGSERAQEAIIDLMEDFWDDPRGLQNLGVHLSLVEKPSEQTAIFFADSLQKIAPESPNFELMLQLSGSVIYTRSHPEIDQDIYSELVSHFDQTHNTSLYQAAVTGLANSGNPGNWDRAVSLLQQTNPQQRNNGLSLLRLVQGQKSAEVERVFLDSLVYDDESNNRRDAAAYLSQRQVSSDSLPVLAGAFLKEKDQSVAINILDAIAHRPEDPKKAAETLKELNAKCGAPQTCAKAESLLLSLLSL